MPGVVHRNTFTGHLARQTERSRRVDILGREVRGADSRSAEPGTENRQLVQYARRATSKATSSKSGINTAQKRFKLNALIFHWQFIFFKEELGTSWILMSSCQPQRLTNPRMNAREKTK